MKMRAVAVAVAMLAISTTGAKAANLLIDGGFEGGTDPGVFTTYYAGDTGLTGWTIDGGSVDHIGTYWISAEGGRSLDLSGYTAGSIHQDFATQIGKQYNVSFSLAGNPDNPSDPIKNLDMGIDTGLTLFPHSYSFDTTGHSDAAMGWETITFSFIADTNLARIFFTSLNDNPYGPALDNISVSAVPLPAALPLFFSGLAGLGLFGRRRRKATVSA